MTSLGTVLQDLSLSSVYLKMPRKFKKGKFKRRRTMRRRAMRRRIQIRPEVKKYFVDQTETVGTTFQANGVNSMCITNVSQGDSFNNRDGMQIQPLSLSLKGTLRISGNAVYTQLRFIALQEKVHPPASNTPPNVTDILENTNIDSKTPSYTGLTSFRLVNRLKNYKIIFDRLINVCINGKASVNFGFTHKFKRPITYQGTGNAVSDQGENPIWVMYAATEATNAPLIAWSSVLRYVDA